MAMCVIQTYKVKWILDGVALRGELPRMYPVKEVRAIPYAEFRRSMYSVLSTPYGCTSPVRLGAERLAEI